MVQATGRKTKVQTLLAALQKDWKHDYFQSLCAVLQAVDQQRLADELTTEPDTELD